jgi:hypothetical protein
VTQATKRVDPGLDSADTDRAELAAPNLGHHAASNRRRERLDIRASGSQDSLISNRSMADGPVSLV